jgi:hypothetical protein
MSRLVSAFGVLLSTLALLTLLVRVQPFVQATALLDRTFHAPPKWTQVTYLSRDPEIQETSRGDHPLESFAVLSNYWAAHPTAKRVVFIGNSQMQAITLAPGESPSGMPGKTYVDLIADRGRQEGNFLIYRLSAGGMSYEEALWYVYYLLSTPNLTPDAIVLQINYQFFWQGGIRDGMLELLKSARFRDKIEQAANAGQPYSESFGESLARFHNIAEHPVVAGQSDGSHSAESGGDGLAGKLENAVRNRLTDLPEFNRGQEGRESFLQMLYRIRLYILRVTPDSARSISGVRLLRSQACVEMVARLCRENRVRLMLFHAPLNPEVKLYLTANDKQAHYDFVNGLAARYQLPVGAFEEAIPRQYWGRMLNGPDPLHLSRTGQKMLAGMMFDMIAKNAGGD